MSIFKQVLKQKTQFIHCAHDMQPESILDHCKKSTHTDSNTLGTFKVLKEVATK